jgi:uncharacterized protein (DUF1778 family)
MSRLGIAQQRLESALARIEIALDRQSAVGVDQDDQSELASALDQALKDNERLQDVSGVVTSRLDATIERLERLLKD